MITESDIQATIESLLPTAKNIYSQSGEDGILAAIFDKIGTANKWCFECGAGDGLLFSNVRHLLDQGWTSVMVEADGAKYQRLLTNSASFGSKAHYIHARVDTNRGIDSILAECQAPVDIDLVVIDVDGQDYYLLNQIVRYSPRVVLIEYDNNADDDYYIPLLNGVGQAGFMAIQGLAAGKHYMPVWWNHTNIAFIHHSTFNKIWPHVDPQLETIERRGKRIKALAE